MHLKHRMSNSKQQRILNLILHILIKYSKEKKISLKKWINFQKAIYKWLAVLLKDYNKKKYNQNNIRY